MNKALSNSEFTPNTTADLGVVSQSAPDAAFYYILRNVLIFV